MFGWAALVGVLAGLVAVAFQWTLYEARMMQFSMRDAFATRPAIGMTMLMASGAVLAGLAAWMTRRYCPSAAGSGIPHVKAVLLHLRPMPWKRILAVKSVGGVLAIGSGMSLGREGPTVQLGAAVGQAVTDLGRLPASAKRQLIASGAGAGLAAAFNAPLAGFIFVLEELQRELSALTYGMALIAAVAADVVTRMLTGQLPSFHVVGYPTPSLRALPIYAVVGVAAGLLGIAFNTSILRSKDWLKRTKLPVWLIPMVVGAIAGAVLWLLPAAAGDGHKTAEGIIRGNVTSIEVLFAVLVVKFTLTIISYGAGTPGGIFAPMLVLGAIVGLLVGRLGAYVLPEVAATPAAFAVVGMAALFSASVRAPLTGIVLIVEMTHNYEQLLALLVACLVAYLVAEERCKPIYEALLEKDLHESGAEGLSHAEPILHDFVIETGSRMDGKLVKDLDFPEGCLLVSVKRSGNEFVPKGKSKLLAGDEIMVIAAGKAASAIAEVQSAARSEH